MKWILVIVSFLFEHMTSKFQQNSSTFLIEKALEKSRSIISLTLLGFVSVLIFAAGIIIAAINAFSQYDSNGVIAFTATFVGGLVLAALAGTSFAVIFTKRNWVTPRLVEEAPKNSVNPLQEAILSLVTEFMNARKEARPEPPPQESRHAYPPPHDSHHAHPGMDHPRGPLT